MREFSAEQIQMIYAAWHGAGVDIAGGNWDRFVGTLPILSNESRKQYADMEKDAARYRWLCGDNMIIPRPSLWDGGVGFICDLESLPHSGRIGKISLDAAIDAAIEQSKK